MINVENILIGMPQIINITSILSILITGNIDLSYFLIYNLIFGNGLNALIKYILQKDTNTTEKNRTTTIWLWW